MGIQHKVKTHRFELQVADQQHAQEMQQWMTHWNATRLAPVLDKVCSRLSAEHAFYPIEQMRLDLGVVTLEMFEERITHALEKELGRQLSMAQNDLSAAATSTTIAHLDHYLCTGTLSWRSQIADRDDVHSLQEKLSRDFFQQPTEYKDLIGQISQDAVKTKRMISLFSDAQLFQTYGSLASFKLEPIEQVFAELKQLASQLKVQSRVWRYAFWQSFARLVADVPDVESMTRQLLLSIEWCLGNDQHPLEHVLKNNTEQYPALRSWQKELESEQEVFSQRELPRLMQSLKQLASRHSELLPINAELKGLLSLSTFTRFSPETPGLLTDCLKELVELFPAIPTREERVVLESQYPEGTMTISAGSIDPAIQTDLDILIHYLQKGAFPPGISPTEQTVSDVLHKLNLHPTPAIKQQIVKISQQTIPMQRMVEAFSDEQLSQIFTHVFEGKWPQYSALISEFQSLGQTLKWDQRSLRTILWSSIGKNVTSSSSARSWITEVMEEAIWTFHGHDDILLSRIRQASDNYPALFAWQQGLEEEELSSFTGLPDTLKVLQSLAGQDWELSEIVSEIDDLLQNPSLLTLPFENRAIFLKRLSDLLQTFTTAVAGEKRHVNVTELHDQLLSWMESIRSELAIHSEVPRLLQELYLLSHQYAAISVLADALNELLRTTSIHALSLEDRQRLSIGLKDLVVVFTTSHSLERQQVKRAGAEERLRTLVKSLSDEDLRPPQENDLQVCNYYLQHGMFPISVASERRTFTSLLTRLSSRPSLAFKQLMGEITQEKLPLLRLLSEASDTLLIKTLAPILKVSRYYLTKLLAEFKSLGHVLKWEKQLLRIAIWRLIGQQVNQSFQSRNFITEVIQKLVWCFTGHKQIFHVIRSDAKRYPILHAWLKELQEDEFETIEDLTELVGALESLASQQTELSGIAQELKNLQRTPTSLLLSGSTYEILTTKLKDLLEVFPLDSFKEDQQTEIQEAKTQLLSQVRSISIDSAGPAASGDLEIFSDYLQHGVFPIGFQLTRATKAQLLARLTDRPSKAFKQLVKETLKNKLPLQRMLLAFSDTQLLKTFASLLNISKSQLSKPMAEFKGLGQALDWDKQVLLFIFWKSAGEQLGHKFNPEGFVKQVIQEAIWCFDIQEKQVCETMKDNLGQYPSLHNWLAALQQEEVSSFWELPRLRLEFKNLTTERSGLKEISDELKVLQQIPSAMFTPLKDRQAFTTGLKDLVQVLKADSSDENEQDTIWKAENKLPSEITTIEKLNYPGQQDELSLLHFYLEHGVLPSEIKLTKQALTKLLIKLNKHPSQAFKQLMSRTLKQREPLNRMVNAFSDTQLIKTFASSLKVSRGRLSKLVAEFKTIGQALNWDLRILRNIFWQSLGNQASKQLKVADLLNQVAHEVIWAFDPAPIQLWSELDKNTGQYPLLRDWKKTLRKDDLKAPWNLSSKAIDHEVLQEKPVEDAGIMKAINDLLEEPQLQLLSSQKRLIFSHGLTQVIDVVQSLEATETTSDSVAVATDDTPEMNRLETHHHDNTVARTSMETLPFEGRKELGPQRTIIDSEAVAAQVQKVRSLLHQLRNDQPKVPRILGLSSFDQADFIGIFNAGLVIFWPFLERLFENLELVSEKAFLDQRAAHKAVQVLYALESGDTDSGFEAMMVLGKVLCGLEISEPLMPISLQDEEQEIIDGMLEAVIKKNKPLWKNLSPENMREAYIQREGLLKTREGYWLLQVKRETYDITLEGLPWSFRVVKLPWMSAALQVEWI